MKLSPAELVEVTDIIARGEAAEGKVGPVPRPVSYAALLARRAAMLGRSRG